MKRFFTFLSVLFFILALGYNSFATAPVVASGGFSPADGATNVNGSTKLVVTFDQDIQFTGTGGTLFVTKGSAGAVVASVLLKSSSSSSVISGSTLTVTLPSALSEGVAYYVGISSGSVENAAGEDFAGITASSGTWNFTIGDYTAPVISTFSPTKGATNVVTDPGLDLVFTFTDANNISAVDGKKIWLYTSTGKIVDIVTISNSINTKVITKTAYVYIDPDTYFSELTSYYVQIEAGAFVDNSSNKNVFAGLMDKSWTFTTEDGSSPSILSKVVTPTTTGARLQVTISETGYLLYQLLPVASSAPSVPTSTSSVGSWSKIVGTGTVMDTTFTGLTQKATYTVYFVAVNSNGDINTVATDIDFIVSDGTAPTLTGYSVQKTSNKTTGLKLVFNEGMMAGTGNLLIHKQSNGAVAATIPAANVSIIDGTGVVDTVLVPVSGLESGVGYYVIAPNGFVKDAAGNAWVSTFTVSTSWQFNAGDYTAPTVSSIALNSSTIPASSDPIKITFSEPVFLSDGGVWAAAFNGQPLSSLGNYVQVVKKSDQSLLSAATATLSSSNIITITPTGVSLLESNVTYAVTVRKAFKDADGNMIASEYKVDFTTPDYDSPTISTNITATNVSAGTKVDIIFSKTVSSLDNGSPVNAANLDDFVTFTYSPSGTNIGVSVTLIRATSGDTLRLTPSSSLKTDSTYTLAYNGAGLNDANNVQFGDLTSFNFTVADSKAPTATLSHTGTVTNKLAADHLTITFSEDMKNSSGTALATASAFEPYVILKKNNANGSNVPFNLSGYVASTRILTIDPTNDLAAGTYYFAVVDGMQDAAGNKLAATSATFNFTPSDLSVKTYNPAIGATGVKLNSSGNLEVKLTYSEAVKFNPTPPAVLTAELYDFATTTKIKDSETVLASHVVGSVLTLTFTAPGVTDKTKYYITVPTDLVVANADNSKASSAITGNTWNFTMGDETAPTASTFAPADGDANVALDSVFTITFSEGVKKGTGNITIATATSGVSAIAVAVSSTTISSNGKTVSIPHSNLTHNNNLYYIQIPSTAFTDSAGNAYAGITTTTDWDFTTVGNAAPTVTALSPAVNSDQVSLTAITPTITFNETVAKNTDAGYAAYLFETGTGATRASLSGTPGVANNNDDKRVGDAAINTSSVVVSGNVVTFNFGYTLQANKEYFILVDDLAFKDLALPTGDRLAFATGTFDTRPEWYFNTGNINGPTVSMSYTERGPYNGMDRTSDIILTFSKAIEKNDGTEIQNSDLPTLFPLSINGVSTAFTGTISADKKRL